MSDADIYHFGVKGIIDDEGEFDVWGGLKKMELRL